MDTDDLFSDLVNAARLNVKREWLIAMPTDDIGRHVWRVRLLATSPETARMEFIRKYPDMMLMYDVLPSRLQVTECAERR